MRQARSEIINGQKFDLTTSMLPDLLGRVDRLTGVSAIDEEANGSVAAAAVDEARYGGRLHFEETELLSFTTTV